MTDSARGRFVWYDLKTPDAAGAQTFYSKVAGWGTQQWEELKYTMFTANGVPIGGIVPPGQGNGAPPHWLAHITVPDVDAAGKKATSLRGPTAAAAGDKPNTRRQ